MTDLKPEDLERVERLLARAIVAANSSAPVETHLGLACEFIGAREDFLSILADRARMEKALEEARKVITVVRRNIMVEVIGGNERFQGVPEILAEDIAIITAALGASQ